MNMSSVSAIGANYSAQQGSAIKATENKTGTAANGEASGSSSIPSSKQDTIEISKEGIYKSLYNTERKLSADTVDAIKEAQNTSFKNMLRQMLGNQGSIYHFSMKDTAGIDFDYSGNDKLPDISELFNENGGIDISKLKALMKSDRSSRSSGGILDERYMPDFSEWTTPREIAKKYLQNKTAAMDENGYWGAGAVSDRVMNMVKALSGGSSERVESLKKSVLEGFKSAKSAWGGSGLDITSKTYDAIISKMDALSSELKASAETKKSETAGSAGTAEKTGTGTAEKIEEDSGLTGDLGLTAEGKA